MNLIRPVVALSSLVLLATACGGGAEAAPTLPPPPRGLENLQMAIPADNALTAEKVELGKMLFFDKRLSSNGSMACQTCHLHEHAWTDGQQFSTKVDGKKNTRNSPSLYNVGYQPHFYWDGRAATLEANVEAAWKGHMGGDPDAMGKALAAIPGYVTEFQRAFKEAPSGPNIVKALASFVRSLQSGGSVYDRKALSVEAKRGEGVFTERCASCHVPPLFSDHLFHNIGMGDGTDVGRGKQDPTKPGAFKTPGLRGAALSGPYFHDGSVATLKEAVTIMAKAGIENPNLDPILIAMRQKPAVTEQEIDDLVAFVESLISTEPFVAPVLPK